MARKKKKQRPVFKRGGRRRANDGLSIGRTYADNVRRK